MFAIAFCILITLGFFATDKMRLFGLTSILFLSVLCYGVNDSDLKNYKTAYDYIAMGNYYTDLGVIWFGICRLFSLCGFDYYICKSVVVLISVAFILQLICFFCLDLLFNISGSNGFSAVKVLFGIKYCHMVNAIYYRQR